MVILRKLRGLFGKSQEALFNTVAGSSVSYSAELLWVTFFCKFWYIICIFLNYGLEDMNFTIFCIF